MRVECAGETWELCADRAVHWPARHTLLIADTHFGKDGIFRAAGIAIPSGINAHDLARLSALVAHLRIERLIVLGDFFHGAPLASGDFLAQFDAWLEAHPTLRIEVIAGNHDRHGGAGRWATRIRWHSKPLLEPPFAFTHEPVANCETYQVCGHVHPVMALRSTSGDRARVPVFWFSDNQVILPAFGVFTGGFSIRPQRTDRVFVIADQEVLAINPV